MRWPWQRRDEELNEEIRAHLHMAEREREERGEKADAARAAARREFGNVGLVKETTREMWGWASLERLWQDVRYGLRMMRRSPGFTAVAVLTLALGIGANTAMFSIFDAVMLRPLPVRDQGKLVVVKWTAHTLPKKNRYSSHGDCAEDSERSQSPGGCSLSLPMFDRIRAAGAGVFSGVGAYTSESSILLTGNGPARQVSAQLVSGDFFPTLGVRPVLGRMLSPADDLPNAEPTIALRYGYWQREFGGSPSVIGKTVRLNNVPFTIVGVVEPQFSDLTPGNEKNLWLTFAQYAHLDTPNPLEVNDESNWWVVVIGRLREGISLAQAQSVVNAEFRNAMLNGPAPMMKQKDEPLARLVPAQEGLNGFRHGVLSPLYALIAAAGILLLIACANVAGLSLAGAEARRKEVAIRLALGAARGRIARQLLTENILVSLLGGACGIFFAYWGVRGVTALLSETSTSLDDFPAHPDLRVMAFAAGISILTGALVGLVPVFRSSEVDLTPTLRESANASGHTAHGRRRRIKLSDILVAAQIALAVVVLAAAGLLIRTLSNLGAVEPGFDTRNMLLFSVDPRLAGYKDPQIQTLYGELQARFAAIPGVVSTSYSSYTLLAGSWESEGIHVPGLQQNATVDITTLAVSPDFFDTMRIPILSGRVLGPADFAAETASSSAQAPLPVIINETFARKYFAALNPLEMLLEEGHGLSSTSKIGVSRALPQSSVWQVVGVARDTKYDNLQRATPPMIYLPQFGGGAYFELRTAGNPDAIMPEVRSIIAQADENVPLLKITTMTDQIRRGISRERAMAQLSGVFGVLSLLLAAVGIYGVISYIAVQRTHEIGIRMALGAGRGNVLWMILRQGLVLTGAGIGVGVAGAYALTGLLRTLLYGVKPTDLVTFVAVSVVMVAVAMFACVVPVWRATRVDPMVALRYE